MTLLPGTWLAPKSVPLMVIDWPTGPEGKDKSVITGDGTTVKLVGVLLADPLGARDHDRSSAGSSGCDRKLDLRRRARCNEAARPVDRRLK